MLTKWYEKRALLLDVFIIINLAFLVLDVYIAHSIEEFHSWETWVPVIFSAIGALILTVMLILQKLDLNHGAGRLASFLVGWASIIVGVWGMFLHLESQFFQVMSLKSREFVDAARLAGRSSRACSTAPMSTRGWPACRAAP